MYNIELYKTDIFAGQNGEMSAILDNRIAIDEDTIRHFNADERIIEITKRYKAQRENK